MTSSSSRLAVAALCAAALLALCRQVSAYSGPTGMALLQDVDNLPRMNDDVNVFQSSSHDRGGGNYDSGNFVTVQAGEYVMLDTKGPGEIARLWLTNASPNHRVRVYLDGEATPRIDRTVTELFSGAIYPFVWPLVGNDTVSSGGYYSYVPIPYSNGCKITTTCKDLYYNVQYRSYLSAPGITSYDTCCDPRGAIASWAALAHRRRGEKLDRNLSVRTGTSADLFDVESGGRLTALRINVKGLDDDSRALKALRNLRLRVYWDDSTSAAIDAPIGPFHCVWFPQSVAKGLFLGSEKRGDFYCYYPMPFARRARIALANQSAEDLEVSASLYWLQSAEDAADLRAGKLGELHTVCRSQTMKSGDPDYLFADLKGRGIALGASALMIGAPGAGQGFLEGDESLNCTAPARRTSSTADTTSTEVSSPSRSTAITAGATKCETRRRCTGSSSPTGYSTARASLRGSSTERPTTRIRTMRACSTTMLLVRPRSRSRERRVAGRPSRRRYPYRDA